MKTEERINRTPDGFTYPKTVFGFINELPKCAICDKIIENNENCMFCRKTNKFFCWDCYQNSKTNRYARICDKFSDVSEIHSHTTVKIKLDRSMT